MLIQSIAIKNFRLLRDVSLSLDATTTVVVGRNNSGKTSLTELIRRLLGDSPPHFRLEDFSLCVQENFCKAIELFEQKKDDGDIRQALPSIKIELRIDYDKSQPLGALSEFIIDLDPKVTTAIISITYQLADGKVSDLFADLSSAAQDKATFFKTLKERVPSFYRALVEAVDPTDPNNTKELEWSRIKPVIKCGFINAQRGLDDETYRDKDVLGKVLETLFNNANSSELSDRDKKIADDLKLAVTGLQASIEKDFTEGVKKFVPALSLFGYPGLSDPGLSTETTLDVSRLLKDHTRIRYHGTGDINLPESFNGLGTRNIIYILFKLYEFFKDYQLSPSQPGIHLIFVEEPEAHLHPQMQEVFIKQLSAIAQVFADTFNGGKLWPVQFVVSTHSSHIANAAPFTATRYFIASVIGATPLRQTQIKDIRVGLAGKEGTEFLHKYMTLTRCDLFFADKAILIEGTTERLILPTMIGMHDTGKSFKECLGSQYISVVEVGGAYAHLFFDLVEFLELKTLVITDIDATKAEVKKKKTVYTACHVSAGELTSNATIKKWFKSTPKISIKEILATSSKDKENGNLCLAYQVPEDTSTICGRSFEAAFMLANLAKFSLKRSDASLEADVWEKTENIKKTEFALLYAIADTAWVIPKYIKDGLTWLSKSELAVDTIPQPSVPPIGSVPATSLNTTQQSA